MNREQFEQLLAEALGDELSPENRKKFEAYLARHPDWQREYDEARTTLGLLAKLDAPPRVVVRRTGDALVIAPPQGSPHPTAAVVRSNTLGGLRRYAAVILIAFTAGYALHAALLVKDAVRTPHAFVTATPPKNAAPIGTASERPPSVPNESFRAALIRTYLRKPSRSGLATCLIAMAESH